MLPVPKGVDLESGRRFPRSPDRVVNIFMLGRGAAGERSSCTAARAASARRRSRWREAGIRIIVTAGGPEKCARCLAHGADVAINYRDDDFATAVRAATDDKGVDVVLDTIGASYLERNLAALAMNGRLVVIGLKGGNHAELDLAGLMVKRPRCRLDRCAAPAAEKTAIVDAVRQHVGPRSRPARHPVLDRVLPLDQAGEAHRIMKRASTSESSLLTVVVASAALSWRTCFAPRIPYPCSTEPACPPTPSRARARW